MCSKIHESHPRDHKLFQFCEKGVVKTCYCIQPEKNVVLAFFTPVMLLQNQLELPYLQSKIITPKIRDQNV
jgi:hypothetical protein